VSRNGSEAAGPARRQNAAAGFCESQRAIPSKASGLRHGPTGPALQVSFASTGLQADRTLTPPQRTAATAAPRSAEIEPAGSERTTPPRMATRRRSLPWTRLCSAKAGPCGLPRSPLGPAG
jgi:hypothetical protein